MNNQQSQVRTNESKLRKLIELAYQAGAGAIDVAPVSTRDIIVDDDLANLCREPRCAFYGLSANCPPNIGGPSAFRDLLKLYEVALAVKMDVPSGCLITNERLIVMKLLHEIVADIEKSAIALGYSGAKAFAAGSCKEIFCNEYAGCRVLTEGGECRNSEYARPTIEGVGINVYELNKSAGWTVNGKTDESNADNISIGSVYGLVLIV